VGSLVLLISKDFTKLVLIGFVIASALGWWAMNNFLNRYEYRINFEVWVLGAVGLFALAITLLIVSTQALKAAMTNPSKSLRSE
jgi:putative ABC transport system permease protein